MIKSKRKIYIIIGTIVLILLILSIVPIVVTKAELQPLWAVDNKDEVASENIEFNQKVYTNTNPLSKKELEDYADMRYKQIEKETNELISSNASEEDIKEYKDTKIIMDTMNRLHKEEFWQILYDFQIDLETSGIRDGSVYPDSPEARLYNILIKTLEDDKLEEIEKDAIKGYLAKQGPTIRNNDELKQKVLEMIK